MLEREPLLDAFLRTARLEPRERLFVDRAVLRAVRRYEGSSWPRYAACVLFALVLGLSLLKDDPRPPLAPPAISLAQFSLDCYGPQQVFYEPSLAPEFQAGAWIEIEGLRISDSFTDSLLAFALMVDAARALASDHRMAALALYEMAASFELSAIEGWRPQLNARIESLRS